MSRLTHWIRTAAEKWQQRPGRNPSVRPIDGYPSSIVDSQGCELGSEICYHVGYAFHLHRHGLLKRTISCRDTRCLYWFSPHHVERYGRRKSVSHFASIDQFPSELPALNRWNLPDFGSHYRSRLEFGFERLILPVFDCVPFEVNGISSGLTRQCLHRLAELLQNRLQLVYFCPTLSQHDPNIDLSDRGKLRESLRTRGAVMADELFEVVRRTDSTITFNTFQLSLLAQSPIRIVCQADSVYLNTLFPGQLLLLQNRRSGTSIENCDHVQDAVGNTITVIHDEHSLLQHILVHLDGDRKAAA